MKSIKKLFGKKKKNNSETSSIASTSSGRKQSSNNIETIINWTDIHPDFDQKNWEGKTYQQSWEEKGSTYQYAQEWIEGGFEPKDYDKVKEWKKLSLTSQDAQEWILAGLKLDDYNLASHLKQNNITPQQYSHYKNQSPQAQLDYFYTNKSPVETIYLKYLNFQQPSELILDNYPNLKGISGSRIPHLTQLTITNCPQLEKIDINSLKNNQQLTLNNLPNLKMLDCYNNNLTNLDLSNCANLQDISAYVRVFKFNHDFCYKYILGFLEFFM